MNDFGIGICVSGKDPDGNEVEGFLTGTGAGGYTGVIVGDRVVAVVKSTIELII